jgi:hypothetical protein
VKVIAAISRRDGWALVAIIFIATHARGVWARELKYLTALARRWKVFTLTLQSCRKEKGRKQEEQRHKLAVSLGPAQGAMCVFIN